MKGLLDFYKYLIQTFLEKELSLNNLSTYFIYHEIVEGGYKAKWFINNVEPYKTLDVLIEGNNIESLILFPQRRGIELSLFDLKEYLKTNYSIFNNFREMSTEFIFALTTKHEIRFIVYKDIRLKKGILNIYNNSIVSENEIYCEELLLHYK
jgi:hypothetical protein